LVVLGLPPTATAADIDEARRRLARSLHPDVGGSVAAMQVVNAAADEALRRARTPGPIDRPGSPRSTPPSPTPRSPTPPSSTSGQPPGRAWVDHPSFTIEALPAEAFEALLVVASWLGEAIDDDPPYAIDVVLDPPIAGWCRLSLVPDAGASTVSIALAPVDGHPVPVLEDVRDAWIDALNRLDWS
jgi:hypothetical protein